MFGIIGIKKLSLQAIIGVYSHEREARQEIILDLKIKIDFSSQSDSLELTINYDKLVDTCRKVVEKSSFQLIETLGVALLNQIASDFELHWIWLRLSKPQAIKEAECAFFEIEKTLKE